MILISKAFFFVHYSHNNCVPFDIELFHLYFSNDSAKIKRKMYFLLKISHMYHTKYYVIYSNMKHN